MPLLLAARLDITTQLLDKIEAKYNKFARKRVVSWQELINTTDKSLSDKEKLTIVNNFFNANVTFINDIDL